MKSIMGHILNGLINVILDKVYYLIRPIVVDLMNDIRIDQQLSLQMYNSENK